MEPSGQAIATTGLWPEPEFVWMAACKWDANLAIDGALAWVEAQERETQARALALAWHSEAKFLSLLAGIFQLAGAKVVGAQRAHLLMHFTQSPELTVEAGMEALGLPPAPTEAPSLRNEEPSEPIAAPVATAPSSRGPTKPGM